MSATFIRRIVDLFIAIFVLGGLMRIARAAAAIYSGEFGTLIWPVQAGAIGDQLELTNGATIGFSDGLLSVPGLHIAHALDLTIHLGSVGIYIMALIGLRSVLIRFAGGLLVVEENTAAFRRIGWLFLIVCGLSAIHALVLQPVILSAVEMPAGMVLHPSLSWNVAGMKNVWLHYDVPLFTFVLGGLSLLFSEAFRVGSAYREDSESVI